MVRLSDLHLSKENLKELGLSELGGDSSSKFGNRKVKYKDLTFDSKREFEYYLILKDREKKGEIKDLRLLVPYTIQEAYTDSNGKKVRALRYKADFVYFDLRDCKEHIIDVKGYKTPVYLMKKKLLAAKGIYIEEVK